MSAPEQNPNPAERAGGVRNKPEQPKSAKDIVKQA